MPRGRLVQQNHPPNTTTVMQITVAGCALRHRDTPRERGDPVVSSTHTPVYRLKFRKMYGLDPGIALGSTRVYLSLWRDPRYSSLYFPGATSPVCPGLPKQRTATPTYAVRLGPSCALSHRVFTFFHIWFSQNQIFQYPLLISREIVR